MLKNDALVVKIGVDTAENGPSKVKVPQLGQLPVTLASQPAIAPPPRSQFGSPAGGAAVLAERSSAAANQPLTSGGK